MEGQVFLEEMGSQVKKEMLELKDRLVNLEILVNQDNQVGMLNLLYQGHLVNKEMMGSLEAQESLEHPDHQDPMVLMDALETAVMMDDQVRREILDSLDFLDNLAKMGYLDKEDLMG